MIRSFAHAGEAMCGVLGAPVSGVVCEGVEADAFDANSNPAAPLAPVARKRLRDGFTLTFDSVCMGGLLWKSSSIMNDLHHEAVGGLVNPVTETIFPSGLNAKTLVP